MPQIADFLEIPDKTLNIENAHSHKARGKIDVLEKIDQGYLGDIVEKHCKDLLDKLFPEIRSNMTQQ